MIFRHYADAAEQLGTRQRRKVANNTYLERRGETRIALRYHATDVLMFDPEGFTVDCHGWRTMSTRRRINAFAAALHIYSHRNEWWISRDAPVVNVCSAARNKWGGAPFVDGIYVRASSSMMTLPRASHLQCHDARRGAPQRGMQQACVRACCGALASYWCCLTNWYCSEHVPVLHEAPARRGKAGSHMATLETTGEARTKRTRVETITVPDPDDKDGRPLKCYRQLAGLAVTAATEKIPEQGAYAVTHLKTGFYVLEFSHLWKARVAIEMLAPLADWTGVEETALRSDEALFNTVQNVAKRIDGFCDERMSFQWK